MRYSHIKQSIVSQYSQERVDANATVLFIMGQPGGGKSACARDALASMGFTEAAGNMVEFVASLRDPVDVLGTPDNAGEYTRWVPPEEFYKLRRGVGPCALLLEELSDAPVAMQNALCGVIYDRRAGNLKLSDELIIIATGNRTEDKSGATRVTSKLAGRTRRLNFTENLDDLCDYALRAGWPLELINFLRFRPALVAEFDPNRFANPTPRTWEDVARMPRNMAPEIELENMQGSVGEGAAVEYLAFKRIFQNLPDLNDVIKNPTTATVPTDLATIYAMMGALAAKATKANFGDVIKYCNRLPKEFGVMCVQDVLRTNPPGTLAATDAFKKWATENNDLMQRA